MSAPHAVHASDAVGEFYSQCKDCQDAVIASFSRQWTEHPKPGYSDPRDLMHKISPWEWANTYVQMPESAHTFGDIIGWFANALEAGRAAGYRQAQDDMRKRLGL